MRSASANEEAGTSIITNAAVKQKGLARSRKSFQIWCRGTELNRPHGDFQSPALPTELPRLTERYIDQSRVLGKLFLRGFKENNMSR